MASRAKAQYDLVANDKGSKAFRSFAGGAKTAGKAVAGLGIAAAGVGAAGLASVVTEAINAGDEIQKLAIQTGASTEFLSEMQHVAALSGASFEKLTKGIKSQSNAIVEGSKGSKAYLEAFNALGLSTAGLLKLKPEEQFTVIAEALSKVENATLRSAIAQKIYGGASKDVLRVAVNGAEGIASMRKEAERLGLSLNRDQVDQMAAANDALERLDAAFRGVGNAMAVEFAEPIARSAEALSEVLVPALRTFGDLVQNVGTILGGFGAALGLAFAGEFDLAANAAKSAIEDAFTVDGDDLVARVNQAGSAAKRGSGRGAKPGKVSVEEAKDTNKKLDMLIQVTRANGQVAVLG